MCQFSNLMPPCSFLGNIKPLGSQHWEILIHLERAQVRITTSPPSFQISCQPRQVGKLDLPYLLLQRYEIFFSPSIYSSIAKFSGLQIILKFNNLLEGLRELTEN